MYDDNRLGMPHGTAGRTAVRILKAQHYERQNPGQGVDFAQSQGSWFDRDLVASALVSKAAVGEVDGSAAQTPQTIGGDDFLESLRPWVLLDRLAALGARKVPAFVRLIGMSGGITAHWVGNRVAIGVSRADLVGNTLTPKTVAALLIVSNEFLSDTSPEGEALLDRDLVGSLAQVLDVSLIDVNNTGSANEPASITAIVTPLSSTGSSIAQIDADIRSMLDALVALGSTLERAVWIMHSRTSSYLATLRATNGSLAFPTVGAADGRLAGLPILVTGNSPLTGSPATGQITLLDADDLVYCDTGASVSLSTAALIDARDDPAQFPATPPTPISLFQSEATGIKSVRRVNWALRRGLVAVLDSVDY